MEKTKKILLILLTFFIFIFILNIGYIYAFSVTDLTGTPPSNSSITDVGNGIITIITTIGSILSVVVLIILGIKYMMGSVEEKAEYKKTMMPYIIGAALVFAASAIAGIVYSIATNIG